MVLTPGIHRVDGTFPNNVYLLTEDDLILIDTGLPGNGRRIVNYVRAIGRNPGELKLIVATHHHPDHSGSLHEVKSLTRSSVAVHLDDAPFIRGERPSWRIDSVPAYRLILWASHLALRPHPVEVELELREGTVFDTLGGLVVLHTPGHTPGSICLYSRERKVLFSGDTLQYSRGKLRRALSMYSWNPHLELASILRLTDLEFDLLLPGDGRPLLRESNRKVREFVARDVRPVPL